MAKFRFTLSIGYANATQTEEIEIPDEDLNACSSDQERERLIEEELSMWASNYIDGGWEQIDD